MGNEWFPQIYFEPLDTMAEAALALVAGDPDTLTGRVALSLDLLAELDRPVYDLRGENLVDGWQPADLPAIIAAQDAEGVKRDYEAQAKAKADAASSAARSGELAIERARRARVERFARVVAHHDAVHAEVAGGDHVALEVVEEDGVRGIRDTPSRSSAVK